MPLTMNASDGRQDDVEPGVQTFRAHRARSAGEDRWHVADAVVSCDDYRPECGP